MHKAKRGPVAPIQTDAPSACQVDGAGITESDQELNRHEISIDATEEALVRAVLATTTANDDSGAERVHQLHF